MVSLLLNCDYGDLTACICLTECSLEVLHRLWCIIFNTTLNPSLFTGVLGLIKGRCVSTWSGVIYSSLCQLAMIFRWKKNERKSIFIATKVGIRCYVYFIVFILLLLTDWGGIHNNREWNKETKCNIFLSVIAKQSMVSSALWQQCVVFSIRCAVPVGVAALFLLPLMINETACVGCDT